MDPSVQTSFIPKKPLIQERARSGGTTSLVFIIAILIFITSIIAAGAAFAYKVYLEGQLSSSKASLEKDKDAFDIPTIQSLIRFDSRINEARIILNNHISPSAIFFFLSQQTLEKVQLTKFSYTLGADATAKVELDGIADSFSTVALQSDQFGASKVLKDVIFSNINVVAGNKITFHVEAVVDTSLISYSKNIGITPTLPPVQQTATTTPKL